ncbi:MAG TPA: BlaI/MecI/CopY family transcriptional regulator [Saprospiraceae bacterium]|nr:BlaI/MecI/CopY family transcriptional regulator [Saprospiraceae bacterium]
MMIRLNKLEEEIMNVLWDMKGAFPKDIMAHLSEPIPPYNTVLSAVRKLESLGYVEYTVHGKSHKYHPKLKKSEYGASIFRNLFHGLIGGSKESLLSFFMKEEDVDIEELKKLVEKIEKNEKS